MLRVPINEETKILHCDLPAEENNVLLAIVAAIVSVGLIISVCVIIRIFQKMKPSKTDIAEDDVESTTSTYLEYSTHGSDHGTDYSFFMGEDGRIYQAVDDSAWYVKSLEQSAIHFSLRRIIEVQ